MEPRPSTAGRDTRRVILDAALDLFADKGFAGTSMRMLARATGVRESALYHHFASKDALFLATLGSVVEQRAGGAAAELATLADDTLEQVLTRLARFLVARLRTPTERKFWRILVADGGRVAAMDPLALAAAIERPRALALSLVRSLQQRGLVRADLAPEMLLIEFGAPIILASNVLLGVERSPFHLPVDAFIEQHVQCVLRMVAP